MKKLINFRIWTMTKLGRGYFDIKASSFEDALLRLGKKEKQRCTIIENLETKDEKLIEEILNINLITPL